MNKKRADRYGCRPAESKRKGSRNRLPITCAEALGDSLQEGTEWPGLRAGEIRSANPLRGTRRHSDIDAPLRINGLKTADRIFNRRNAATVFVRMTGRHTQAASLRCALRLLECAGRFCILSVLRRKHCRHPQAGLLARRRQC